ncbi:hypothetical protein ACFPZ0_01020 [Streptomonospora nanhaiensis]|uniref:Uncharacterized protein n=1 Tax=Streptomonospora nanhaiensis TaxID=1323731 RepID=A0A853BGI1_9ACTN|nr:hypothetical protein [Streptomonospora nanhaiensis]MBV2364600.1 hypothetical protein [Streptomonospora nanhaiensis]NYI94140.1 hypothetical protein [Streptomonospora nanhaiensis]
MAAIVAASISRAVTAVLAAVRAPRAVRRPGRRRRARAEDGDHHDRAEPGPGRVAAPAGPATADSM